MWDPARKKTIVNGKVQKDDKQKNDLKLVPSKESKTTQHQTLFGDGGFRGRRGEGVGGDLLRNYY